MSVLEAPVEAEQDELRLALQRVDLRLRLAVEGMRAELAERARDPYRGLYISEQDVDALLASMPTAEIARRLTGAPAGAEASRLAELARLFGLDDFEREALLVCLAPEVDLRYERLYAYLQDDVTRRRPSVDLVLRLLCPHDALDQRSAARVALGPAGALFRHGLLTLSDEAAAQWPLLARPLRVDERVVEFLLGSDRPDARLAGCAEVRPPRPDGHESLLLAAGVEGLVPLLQASEPRAWAGPLVYLHGPTGSGKRTIARAACAAAGWPLLLVDVAAALAQGRDGEVLALAAREALLQRAVLALDGFDSLLAEEQPDLSAARALARRLLAERPGPTLLLGEARWEPAAWFSGRPAVRVELGHLPLEVRTHLWHGHFNGHVPAAEVADLAARYRLDEEGLSGVAAAVRGQLAWRGDSDESVTAEDLRAAARAVAAPPLDGLARRLELRYGWEDVVLPPDGLAQLRELCGRARHQGLVLGRWGFGRKHARRAGLTALFVGPPGTGKTMSSEIVAGDLGLELYRIDLSAVVSKYIGETEKNLERIFRAADHGDAVLLFDEADAIFGKRSEVRDARDRYANVEVAYLLQRLEMYEGVAILTTNLRGNVDEAFLRRLDYVIEFPLPEEPERLQIWRRALPPEAPLAADVDLPFLARKFKLAGGHIRNIALTAAYLAASDARPIGMKHLVRATRRERQKLGKLVAESDFEQYYALLRDGSG